MKSNYNTVNSHTKEGMYTTNYDFTGRGGDHGMKEILLGKVPKNVHGSNEFIIKVQVPTGGPRQGARCMFYDARRTLGHLFFEYDQYGAAGLRCAELVHSSAQAHKGYFQARREGANLRIFVDRILEPQPW